MYNELSRMAIVNCNMIDPSKRTPTDSTGIIIEKNLIADLIIDNSIEIEQMQTIDASGLCLLPGFIDCHLHITGLAQGYPPALWLSQTKEERQVRSIRQAWELLMSGFTTVIDISNNGHVLKDMISRGEIYGPRIIPCLRGLAAPGGAGYIPNAKQSEIEKLHPWAITCNGTDNLITEIRQLKNDGAEFIKFWISGAGMHDQDDESKVQYSQSEINTIVGETHRCGLKIQAHCTCSSAVKMAIEGEVDFIIHGFGMDHASKESLIKKGIAWAPTCEIESTFSKPGDKQFDEFITHHYQTILEFYNSSCPIVLGSDTFADDRTPFGKFGLREMLNFIDAGIPVEDVIKIATVNGAKLLGLENLLGTLAIGATADLILMNGRPDKDPSLLNDPDNIVFVMREGIVVKDSLGLSGGCPNQFGPLCI
ncbi:MAG: amidohydrolase family protein [Desulfobacterales bacterium]|nr:amidohydrolase family protein [Desulfobacterales bacterium]